VHAAVADIEAMPMPGTVLGHVGDGNFHVLVLCDRDSEEELKLAKAFNERLVRRALEMGGTCTGEHGIGRGKIDFLEEEHGPAVDVMRAIKRALDPSNLMNPGKIFRL
jgi:D-lactate dehydrogenase (cytochrome)